MSPLSLSEIDALLSLINESVSIFKAEYQSSGISVPDLRNASSAEHDSMKARASYRLNKAVKVIEAACAQLTAIVVRPELTLINASAEHTICACLYVATSRDIAGLLLNSPNGRHVSELSDASSVDADHLGRILRLLATNHIFQETAPNTFANNMISVKLATDSHVKECVETRTREALRASSYIGDFLEYDGTSPSMPTSPFQLAYGLPLMDYLISPEGKKTMAKFMAGVTGWGEIAVSNDIAPSSFPWDELFSRPGTVTICDVGAGEGHIVLKLARAYSNHHFRIILQDRQAILELGKKAWGSLYPEAVEQGRVDFIPIDFFTESPVHGCNIYYIRHCIHNWPDEKCIVILSNIAKAMHAKEGSKLLIHEIVLRPATSQGPAVDSTDPAAPPAPLLSNFGVACFRDYSSDLTMMALLNAKERTLDEYIAIGKKAGLAFDCLWNLEGSGLMQFRLGS